MRDVIGRGDDEHRRTLLAQPRQKSTEDAGGCAPIARTTPLGTGKGLVDFVYPQDSRGNRLGDRDGPAHVLLGRTHEATEHPTHVEAQQRQLPLARDGLSAKAFAAPLHAQQQHSLGERQTEDPRFRREGRGAFNQPVLENGQATHAAEVLGGGVILQQAALADDLLLLGEHLVDVVSAEARVLNDDLGEHILGLAERQTQSRLQQPITTRRVEINDHLLDGAHILQNSIQQRAQVFLGGQRETQDGNFLVQFRGNLQQWRH